MDNVRRAYWQKIGFSFYSEKQNSCSKRISPMKTDVMLALDPATGVYCDVKELAQKYECQISELDERRVSLNNILFRTAVVTQALRIPSLILPFVVYQSMSGQYSKSESALASIVVGLSLYGLSLIPENIFKKDKKSLEGLVEERKNLVNFANNLHN